MNILKLYDDFNIPHITEGHKHCRPGWVNVECPFCTGNPGYHLGVPVDGGVYHCWRCGNHPPSKVLSKLLNTTEHEARKLLLTYVGRSLHAEEPPIEIRRKTHKLPDMVTSLSSKHKQYLDERGYDPDMLEQEWNLKSTGFKSYLDGIDYCRRILAPVYWDGERVSFQARDVTDRHPLKYMACPKKRELIEHQTILYGKQELWKPIGICVEGITDVWRFGMNAFATFGIDYTPQQLRWISKLFSTVWVVFDSEVQAQAQGKKLAADLRFRGLEAESIKIDFPDPGKMPQGEADYLVKQLVK